MTKIIIELMPMHDCDLNDVANHIINIINNACNHHDLDHIFEVKVE